MPITVVSLFVVSLYSGPGNPKGCFFFAVILV
jgi:hypothetical protein